MHNAGTIFGGNKIAGQHAESILAGIHPVDQLVIGDAFELAALEFIQYLIGNSLVAGLECLNGNLLVVFGEIYRAASSLARITVTGSKV